jgi:hypothetical protein
MVPGGVCLACALRCTAVALGVGWMKGLRASVLASCPAGSPWWIQSGAAQTAAPQFGQTRDATDMNLSVTSLV